MDKKVSTVFAIAVIVIIAGFFAFLFSKGGDGIGSSASNNKVAVSNCLNSFA